MVAGGVEAWPVVQGVLDEAQRLLNGLAERFGARCRHQREALANQQRVAEELTQPGEPILRARAAELGARLRYRTECTSLSQDADGVTAILRDLPTGAESSVRARYVVAADGNRSPVRERLAIGMRGHGLLSHSITIYFRALADLGPLLADRNQGVHYVTNPLMRGFFRLDRSGNAGFLVVNLVGDTSRP